MFFGSMDFFSLCPFQQIQANTFAVVVTKVGYGSCFFGTVENCFVIQFFTSPLPVWKHRISVLCAFFQDMQTALKTDTNSIL